MCTTYLRLAYIVYNGRHNHKSFIRSPHIVCRRTYLFRDFSFFLSSSSSFRQLPSKLAERNSTKTGHMLGSRPKCTLKMHVQNLGYPFPIQIRGPKTTLFDDFAKLTAYIFGMRHDIHKGQRVPYIVSKPHELRSTNGFKLEVSFQQPSINYAFHFIARLPRRRSANGTKQIFAKRRTAIRAR